MFEVVHNLVIDKFGAESETLGSSKTESPRTGWPIVAFGAMLWALDLVLRPQAQKAGLSALQIVLFEHLALALIFLPGLVVQRNQWQRLKTKSWLGLAFIAIFGSAIATLMITLAYQMGSPLLTALLQKTQPIFTVILAGLFLGEHRKPMFWPLFVGALAATYLLAFGLSGIDVSTKLVPVGLALGAAAIWGTCTVVGRVAVQDLAPSVVAGWRFMIALPFLLALAVRGSSGAISANVSGASLLPILLIVIFPDALGMLLYYIGLKRTPASLATLAELAFPATALIISLSDQKQALNIFQWLGLAALLFCLHLIQTSRSVSVVEAV